MQPQKQLGCCKQPTRSSPQRQQTNKEPGGKSLASSNALPSAHLLLRVRPTLKLSSLGIGQAGTLHGRFAGRRVGKL